MKLGCPDDDGLPNFYKSAENGFFIPYYSTWSNHERMLSTEEQYEADTLKVCANWCHGDSTCVGFGFHTGDGVFFGEGKTKCWSYHQGFIMDNKEIDSQATTYTKCIRGINITLWCTIQMVPIKINSKCLSFNGNFVSIF